MQTQPRHDDFFQTFLTVLVIIGLGSAIYSNVLRGEFISDDYITIVDNPAVRDFRNIPHIVHAFNTRFLVGLSFALNYAVGGLDVLGYHLVNIAVHLMNSFLVYIFLLILFKTPALQNNVLKNRAQDMAFFAGLIFLCHPVQTQGVSYLTQRAVALGTLFYLLTLIYYLKARVEKSRLDYCTAGLAFLTGMFCKEMILTVPLTLLVAEWFFFGGFGKAWRQRLKPVLPFFLLVGVLPLLLLQDRFGSALGLKGQIKVFSWPYFLTELNVLRTYLRLLVFPAHQMHEYGYPVVQRFAEPGTLFSIGLLAAVVGMGLRLYKKNRLLSFTVFWFFITTSVEVLVVSTVHRATIYEHWLYLPMVGFSIFGAVGLGLLCRDEERLKRVGFFLIFVLSVLTYQRNFVWQNEILFWEDGINKAPHIPHVYLASGVAYQRKHLFSQAYQKYRDGLRLYDGHPERLTPTQRRIYARILNNLSLLSPDSAEADHYFKEALRIDSHNSLEHNSLAFYYYQNGQYRQAVEAFTMLLNYHPGDPLVRRYLDLSYQALKGSRPPR